jgi:RND superfamily putative drug exporter
MKLQEQSAQQATASRVIEEDALAAHGLYRVGIAYGRGVYRFRWLIVGMWVVALLVGAPFAAKLAPLLSSGGYTFNNSESVKVSTIAQQTLHQPVSQLQAVFHSDTTPATDPAYQQEIATFSTRARGFAHVTAVVPGGVGTDGRTALVLVNFDQDPDAVTSRLPAFRALLPTGTAAGPARVLLTGDIAVYDEFSSIAQTDAEKADATAVPLALLVLLVVFGTLLAAALPILLALVAVPVALAIVYVLAQHVTTSISVLSIASVIGLGLSIDYSLFMTRRFREELARGRTPRDAMAWTVATAGEAILFSGLTVMIGFCGLLLLGIPVMTSFGFGGAAVVLCAMLAALTLLPAILGLLGQRVNRLRLPLLNRFTNRAGTKHGFWHRWALGVMKRPVLIIAAVVVVLIGLGWPVTQMTLGIPDANSLPADAPARQGLDLLHAQFPASNNDPIYLIAQTPDGSSVLSADNLAKLGALTTWVGQQAHITGVTSLTQIPAAGGAPALTEAQLTALYESGAYQQNPALAQFVAQSANGGTTMLTAIADAKLDSQAGKDLIAQLRAGDAAHAGGLKVLVGGFQAVSVDFNNYLYGNFFRAILFILLATFVLLLLMFRSVLLPLKAVVMNVLSISAAYGVLVFVFQWGNLANVLGFRSEGFVESTVPVLLFCILFGLSMDYEVFLLSRVREEWLRTGNNRYAVAQGLEKTGGVITNAALILLIVTGAITFTTLISTKEIGLGMTVAVLVDATIIRTLLVPATMRLLGRWNWWLPGRPLPVERPMPAEAGAE